MTMTTVRAKFILWLIALAAVLGAIRCPGQTSAVQFNTSTGAVVEPSAGATPLIGRAGFQEFTADANGTILASTSYAEWNVPTQSTTRYLTLPTVGTDAGKFAPGRELVLSVVANNDEGVLDLDELYFTATTPTIYRLQAKSDGTWRVVQSMTFSSLARLASGLGSASNYDVGTSGTTVALNNSNITRTGTLTQSARVNVTASGAADSALQVGTIGVQPFSLNNSWFGENIYYNGTSFIRRALGSAGMFYFFGPEGQFRFYASGAAGSATGDATQFKVNADGAVAIGGSISPIAGNYTGAALIAESTGVTIGGGTKVAKIRAERSEITSGGTITITDTAITEGSIINVTAEYSSPGNFTVTKSAGVSFTITSSDNTDTGYVMWTRIVPGS